MHTFRVWAFLVIIGFSCAAPSIRSTVSHPGDQPARPNEPMAPSLPEQPVVAIPFENPPPPNPRLSPTGSSAGFMPIL
ncbi:MAG: hypothetical protein WCW34_00790 [Patescibacteria group bacterium]